MRAIARTRFDALAAYCRAPGASALLRELAWFEAEDGNILAMIAIDTDGEFAGLIFARDMMERFRCIGWTSCFDTPEKAFSNLHSQVMSIVPRLTLERVQGDEIGNVVDFFTPLTTEDKLHPHFLGLANGIGFRAARKIISAMMRWYDDIDGNFVEQFQTTGFDARVWELYLFATLTEAGLHIERPSPAPDFLARGPLGEFTIEATTINRSQGPNGQSVASQSPRDEAEVEAYVRHYLPIRYAGPLTAKLGKEYWTKPVVTGKPLVFAIQDFHDEMSMTYSGTALTTYLYGYVQEAVRDSTGTLGVVPQRITEHRWGTKTVPSGFFTLPGTENVSAVIFNSGGTLSKFNRMGVSAGFGSDGVVLIRQGLVVDPDPQASDPIPFVHFVGADYPETWIEGMDVYHNPSATHPFDPELLPGAAHHKLLADGLVESTSPAWSPLQSRTSILTFSTSEQSMSAAPSPES
jgi:hypothetical protein